MNRYQWMGLKNCYRIPGWGIQVAVRNVKNKKLSHESNYEFVRKMVRTINHTGRVAVKIAGEENLPREQGYILFPNHQGFFDSMALLEACEPPFHLVAMKEIMDIPFLNYLFRLFRVKLMDREDVRQSFEVINEVTKEVKSGANYVIFAEGTLESQENTVSAMKPGAFKGAVNAGCPIVPVALHNCFLPFERKGIGPVEVAVTFLKPLYREDYQGMKTREIAEIVRKTIQQRLTENQNG